MTSAPPEPELQPKNPGVEKPEGFFVKNSCIVRKSDNPHFGALLLLLEHVGLPHVLDLAVQLVNFFGWMSQGAHSEPLLLIALFWLRQELKKC